MSTDPAVTRTGSIRQRVRTAVRTLVHEHASPGRLGAAIALGVFVGCVPIFGFQTLVVLALAVVLRLNKLGVLLGVQISVPPVMPLVAFVDVQVGAWVLRGRFLPVSIDYVKGLSLREMGPELAADAMVGGCIVGAVLAAALGSGAALVIRARRRRKIGEAPLPP